MSSLSAPYLHDEAAAHEFVESVLWPDGPVCPHCGGTDRITKVKANPEKRIRVGLWRCGGARRCLECSAYAAGIRSCCR